MIPRLFLPTESLLQTSLATYDSLLFLFVLQTSLATYEGLYQQYASLASSLGQEPDISLSLDPHQQITDMRSALTAGRSAAAAAAAGGGRRNSSDTGGMPAVPMANVAPAGMAGGRSGRQRLSSWSDVTYLLGNGGVVTARDGSEVPQQVIASHRQQVKGTGMGTPVALHTAIYTLLHYAARREVVQLAVVAIVMCWHRCIDMALQHHKVLLCATTDYLLAKRVMMI
jgi:hypothetical protein